MPLDENIMIQISLFIKRIHGTNPNPDSFLFFSPSKGKTSKLSSRAIQKRLKQHACSVHESCDEVPLDMHSHLFRHTRATNWVKERHRPRRMSCARTCLWIFIVICGDMQKRPIGLKMA